MAGLGDFVMCGIGGSVFFPHREHEDDLFGRWEITRHDPPKETPEHASSPRQTRPGTPGSEGERTLKWPRPGN